MLRPQPYKASTWLTAAASLAALSGFKRLAGGLLLIPGIGYLGAEFERHAGLDLRRWRDIDPRRCDPAQYAAHLAMVCLGFRFLNHR